MHWPTLTRPATPDTPEQPGDLAILAYEVLKDGTIRPTTAAVVRQALIEVKADEAPVSLDSNLAPRAKSIALQVKGKPITNGTCARYLRNGKPSSGFLRGPFADFGLVIVCAGGKGVLQPWVTMPKFKGRPGLNMVAVVPAANVTWRARGKKSEERDEDRPPF